MDLFCIGLSHHTANVETRERYARLGELDARLRDATGCPEVLLLSTCNRVEVYGVAEGAIDNQTIARCLRATPLVDDAEDADAFYRHEGDACVQHLFRVASGLDSMVVGETEVLGQTKQAYEAARQSGGAGPYLHRLFQRAFRVAKQVRTHTEITRGAVSVGSVAVELAGKIFGELKQRKVLVLGAGETSEKTARALASRGVTDLRVSNRSPERALLLAEAVGGRAVPFAGWEHQCREIDILISSTSASEPLLTREKLAPILHVRWDRPLFIIDIAVPRDVAPDVNEMEGVFLYDMDSLQALAEQSRAQRRQQFAAAEEIIGQHVSDFANWLRGGAAGIAWARRGRALRGVRGHVHARLRTVSRIILGTRGSDLARTQTAMVEAALRANAPELEITIEIIRTSGDEKSGKAPPTLPSTTSQGRKGMFTAEIERALLDRRIDVAVHSAKDLPSEMTEGLEVCAALPRAAVEDVLIAKSAGNLAELPAGATVATGSVRRQHQLRRLRPDLAVADLRGNVPTRLRKLAANDWAGIILARAGLERLGFDCSRGELECDGHTWRISILPTKDFLPAGGQGIVALQTRSDDEKAKGLLEGINHPETLRCLKAEREFLRLLQGDCGTPVGVLATIEADLMTLRAEVFEEGEARQGATVRNPSSRRPELVAEILYLNLHAKK